MKLTILKGQINAVDRTSALLGAGTGLCCGLLGGYLIGHLVAKRSSEKWIASEVEGVKEYYYSRLQKSLNTRQEDAGKTPMGYERAVDAPGEFSGYRSTIEHPERVLGDAGIPGSATGHAVPEGSGDETSGERDPLEGMLGPNGEEPDDNDNDDDDGADDSDPPPLLGTRVITVGQFHEEKSDYNKITITYYEADNVLVDDREIPIRDYVKVVGADFRKHYGGEGSDDPNIVHVRNDRLESDFEIVKDGRAYVDVILNYGNPR